MDSGRGRLGGLIGEIPIPGLEWDFVRLAPRERCMVIAGFALALALLIVLGYTLCDVSESLTVMWPATGLLFMALLTSPGRRWVWIVGLQVAIQTALYLVYAERAHWLWGPVFTSANSVEAMVGAVLARRLIPQAPAAIVKPVIIFLASITVGSAVGAAVGAFASIHTAPGSHFVRQWQLWWAGSWLGSLFIAPVLFSWAVRRRTPQRTALPPAPAELVLFGGALLGMTYWTFSSPPGVLTSIFQSPVLVLALAIAVAFRMPPRWATTLTALSALIATYYTSRHLGPYSMEPTAFARIERVQLNSAALIIVNYILVVALFDIRNAMQLARRSDERYRNFVEKSSEAVWQVELTVPMPPALDPAEQLKWLQRHACVVECNLRYRDMNRMIGVPDAEVHVWRADAPWSAVYLDNLESAARDGYCIDALQFSLGAGANRRTYLCGFTGVMAGAALVRVWGVARDITQLVELNESLRQKQARLQLYARQLTSAEERARRSIAVDLHDGIGQQLVALALNVEAGAAGAPAHLRIVLNQASRTLREIHAMTQRVIADLSPPGLYELGLEAALKWLSVYMRGHDQLQVELQVDVQDSEFDLELRILAFKLIRELLRNVVKHARVDAATVKVGNTDGELFIDVIDRGVGFEWQLSLFETRGGGFGLWSIAERVREAGGELNVDTAPGRGCSVSISLPLRRADRSGALARKMAS